MWWVGALLVCAYGALAGLVDRYVGSQPYMDELFHVPQTERYCRGEFWTWDPMITTFPGLYFVFTLLFTAVDGARQVLGLHRDEAGASSFLCSVMAMRAMNTLFGVLNFFLFYRLVAKLYRPASAVSQSGSDSRRWSAQHVMMALLPHLFPVQFFFYFLYYTDTVSTFFVFLCYYLSLCDRTTLSGVAGFAAVACRQTNIVWVCFVAFSVVLRQYRRTRTDDAGGDSLTGLLRFITRNFESVCEGIWIHLVLLASFLVFVYHNQGIVIGDRTQHSPRLHVVQLFYFLAFTAAWVWPRLGLAMLGELRRRGWSAVKQGVIHFVAGAVVVLPVMLYAIHNYTHVPTPHPECNARYAHPYLLADNRHYPFYLWKNFFRRNDDLKYAYSLAYYTAGYALWKLLGTRVSSLWRLTYLACTAAVLVPASLIEFRYFVVPFLFLILHTMPSAPGQIATDLSSSPRPMATCTKGGRGRGEKDRRKKPQRGSDGIYMPLRLLEYCSEDLICLAIECLLFATANALTLCIFVLRPFAWPSGEVARIMW